MDRKDSIVSEEADRQQESDHIERALSQCGYPEWSIKKVTNQKDQPKSNKHPPDNQNKGLVVLPYIEGLSEKASRVFKKQGFSTSLKPHHTIKSVLVHPKDKRDPLHSGSYLRNSLVNK